MPKLSTEEANAILADEELLIARDAAQLAYRVKDKSDAEYIKYVNDLSNRLNNREFKVFEFEKFYDMDRKITAGCVIETEDHLYVAFKGTSTSNSEEITNDMKAELVNVHFGPQNDEDKYMMHQGFYEEYLNSRSSVIPIISRIRDNSPQKKIVFCGHSLGGAMASIAALELALEKKEMTTCITFGTPKVFSSRTADEFDKLVDCKRVIDTKDPAGLYPLMKLGYKHAGTELLTDRGHLAGGHLIQDTYDVLIAKQVKKNVETSKENRLSRINIFTEILKPSSYDSQEEESITPSPSQEGKRSSMFDAFNNFVRSSSPSDPQVEERATPSPSQENKKSSMLDSLNNFVAKSPFSIPSPTSVTQSPNQTPSSSNSGKKLSFFKSTK